MRHPLHVVTSPEGCNATSPRYIGPLLGNGELACFLDEHGVMHDYPALAGFPAPRIYWAGRRFADRRMTPFGYFSLVPSWEWMASTRWSQALDVRAGLVETVHERGPAEERTETLLLLDRNLFALHKQVRGLKGSARLRFSYRLCPPGGGALPPDTHLTGGGADATGAWLDYRLDGVLPYHGRIALWADLPCRARRQGNLLEAEVELAAADDVVTLYLAFADDLGDEMLYGHTGWLGRHAEHPLLAPVLADLRGQPVEKDDPERTVENWRQWTSAEGWRGVRAHQGRCWEAFWSAGWVDLPAAPEVQAVWETGMYATRTQLTRWSIPVAIHGDYFNGQYFHDEMAGAAALLQAGHWGLVRRMAEHKLSVFPQGMEMLDGTGARGDAPSYEGGHFTVSPMGCSIYEVHASGEPPQLVWHWLRYAGREPGDLERYYPVLWGAAEFFRRWMVYQGPDGKYCTGACVDFNESLPAVRNGAATVAATISSLRLAARAAELLGREAELIPLWREIADGLEGSVQVNRRGALCQYAGDEGVSFTTLRLVATPFAMGSVAARDPRVGALVEALLTDCKLPENWACAASHDPAIAAVSQDVANPDPVAWTWTTALLVGVLAARGDGDRAAEVVAELIRCSNAFGSLYECKVMTDGFLSLPWFVTSSSELSASISLLLLQCPEGRIDLLPAVPEGWTRFAYQLAAEDRATVRVEVEGGALAALTLSAPSAERRRVRVPVRFDPARALGPPERAEDDWQEFLLAPGVYRCPQQT